MEPPYSVLGSLPNQNQTTMPVDPSNGFSKSNSIFYITIQNPFHYHQSNPVLGVTTFVSSQNPPRQSFFNPYRHWPSTHLCRSLESSSFRFLFTFRHGYSKRTRGTNPLSKPHFFPYYLALCYVPWCLVPLLPQLIQLIQHKKYPNKWLIQMQPSFSPFLNFSQNSI